jgi:hypothetical protein
LADFGKIREKRRKRHTLFFLLSYDDEAQNIKVEINRRSFGSSYELKTYLGISMLVMVGEDMFAHKLVAMLEEFGAERGVDSQKIRDLRLVVNELTDDYPSDCHL